MRYVRFWVYDIACESEMIWDDMGCATESSSKILLADRQLRCDTVGDQNGKEIVGGAVSCQFSLMRFHSIEVAGGETSSAHSKFWSPW